MAKINITGNADIDQATAEIALVLRDASPGQRDQEHYDQAIRLRDAIMAGTRELDQGFKSSDLEDVEDSDRYEREAREEFRRTGATHTHVSHAGNRVARPGSRCPGAMCYAVRVIR